MRHLLLISSFLIGQFVFCQVVFLETFYDPDDAVTGIDNTAGLVAWATLCPGCFGLGDYFKVVGGELVALDTDESFATFTTSAIDISTCTEGLNISFDLNSAGDMEDCGDCADPGFDCVDWVKLEYNIDGLGWNEVAGSTCPIGMTSAPGEMVQLGDVGAGPITITSPCVDIGTNLEVRITVLTNLGDEFWYIDNVTVTCTSCLLPIKFDKIQGRKSETGLNEILWTTLQERSNDYFHIERSTNGNNYEKIGLVDGAGNSTETIDYSFIDTDYQINQTVYYRLKQFDFNGDFSYSDPISIQRQESNNFVYTNHQIQYNISKTSGEYNLVIYNLSGAIVDRRIVDNIGAFNWNKTGLFLFEVRELGIKQKITTY